jgi:hypothetical protein
VGGCASRPVSRVSTRTCNALRCVTSGTETSIIRAAETAGPSLRVSSSRAFSSARPSFSAFSFCARSISRFFTTGARARRGAAASAAISAGVRPALAYGLRAALAFSSGALAEMRPSTSASVRGAWGGGGVPAPSEEVEGDGAE